MRALALLLFAVLPGLPVSAQSAPEACESQRDMPEMVACLNYHLGQAERELGAALAELRSRYPQTATQLDQAQAAWAAYRDATCHYVADPSDYGRGTETILTEIACKTAETSRRAVDLQRMFSE